jgi:hypothetical protein
MLRHKNPKKEIIEMTRGFIAGCNFSFQNAIRELLDLPSGPR